MKCIMRVATCIITALSLSPFAIRDAAAAQLTLNLVQSQSYILQTGAFSGIPFAPQEGTAGTTDANPARPSHETTFQGTITVDVDNVLAPTGITILESNANADVSGTWLPEVELYEDLNGNGNFGEFGLPPGGDSRSSTGDNPAPATPADWGVKVVHPAFGVTIAYGAARDVVYTVTRPLSTVNALGQIGNPTRTNPGDTTEKFEFGTPTADPNDTPGTIDSAPGTGGWFDYWVQAGGSNNIKGRSDLTGGDDPNVHLLQSMYTVTPLGGGNSLVTLTIPIDVNNPGGDADFFYDGQFVATYIVSVPEPTSVMLLGLGGTMVGIVGFRRRK
jgi:hypothetical protein